MILVWYTLYWNIVIMNNINNNTIWNLVYNVQFVLLLFCIEALIIIINKYRVPQCITAFQFWHYYYYFVTTYLQFFDVPVTGYTKYYY
jgi:hypothetical protein